MEGNTPQNDVRDEATAAWLADGLALAVEQACKVLEDWMAFDADDESASVYGAVVDRQAAYIALAEIIQRTAIDRASVGHTQFKADRAAEQLRDKISELTGPIARRNLIHGNG